MLLATFADDKKPHVLDAIESDKITRTDKTLKFNNSALYSRSSDLDRMFWNLGIINMENFFRMVLGIESTKLIQTLEVIHTRERLDTTIQEFMCEIQIGCQKSEELQKELAHLEKFCTEMEQFKNYTYETLVHKSRLVDLNPNEYVLKCLHCHVTCHFPCEMEGDENEYCTEAMDEKGLCKMCPEKCPWKEHRRQPQKCEFFNETETKTDYALEQKYEEAKSNKPKIENRIEKYERELLDIQVKMFLLTLEAHNNLLRLGKIALQMESLSTANYVDILISDEQSRAEDGWEKRIEALNDIRKGVLIMEKIIAIDDNHFTENIGSQLQFENMSLHEKAQIARHFLQDHKILPKHNNGDAQKEEQSDVPWKELYSCFSPREVLEERGN